MRFFPYISFFVSISCDGFLSPTGEYLDLPEVTLGSSEARLCSSSCLILQTSFSKKTRKSAITSYLGTSCVR
jgi:hypothetical protein